MDAFAQSMLDQLANPGTPVDFTLRIVGGRRMSCSCGDFMTLRPEEKTLIRSCLGTTKKEEPRVLDIGGGIGRHSAFARETSPDAIVTIVEINQRLREYCQSVILGAVGCIQFGDVPDDARFDVAFLMGNGLGIFGSEDATRQGLRRLARLIVDGGCVLIEAGNFNRGDFSAVEHTIEYGGVVDGPFTWGYATRQWLQRELHAAGFEIDSFTPSSVGGPFFICHATKRPEV